MCKKKCPICRSVCHIDPISHSHNLNIENCVKLLFPKEYERRHEEIVKEKSIVDRTIPVFIMNDIKFPKQTLGLHLFEQRYKHMMNRCVSGTRHFAYLSPIMNDNNNGRYQPYTNDIALLIYIIDCQFFADGRCLMEGVCVKRILILDAWIEKGTQGLWYCKYEDYNDVITMSNTNTIMMNNNHNEMLELLELFVEHTYNHKNVKQIENECIEKIILNKKNFDNISEWTFYITSLIILILNKKKNNDITLNWIKEMYKTKNIHQRIQNCYQILKKNEKSWRIL